MQREKVQLDLNVPVGPLQLMYPTGKLMEDRGFGQSVMYTTADNRVLFVDLETSSRITALELQPGECFHACKSKSQGKTRVNVWLSPATESMRAVKEIEAQPADEFQAQLAGTCANLLEGKPPAAPRPTPRVAPGVARTLDSHPQPQQQPLSTGTNGPQAMPRRTPDAIPMKATYGAAMSEFLLMAGRATREAEKVLGAEGGSVRFDSRDVAALATTMLIQAAREGWITWRPGECQ